MKIGDILFYQDRYWKLETSNREFRTCQLVSFDGTKQEVADDLDENNSTVLIVCNPAEQWPFCSIAIKVKAGPLRGITRAGTVLTPMVDWIPSDFQRPGGAIFFNPRLRLKVGEILVATHQDGSFSRITITPGFGTLKRKAARAKAKEPKPQQSVYDQLMDDSLFRLK